MKLAVETFSQGLRKGFWFCDRCDRVALEVPALAVDILNEQLASCPHCHKRTARWVPPVLPADPANRPGADFLLFHSGKQWRD